jgi:6-phosphogluconate dehydrogenase
VGGNKDLIAGFIDRLISLDLRIIGLVVMGVAVLLNALSFTLSVAIYAKKEF